MSSRQILLLIFVFIIIVWFFETIKNQEKFEGTENIELPRKKHFGESPIVPELPTIPKQRDCPIRENDLKTDYYIEKSLMGQDFERCPRPVQTAKEFNKDFFKFRDFTEENSSIRPDSVDKVLNLYLSGELSQARNKSNMKIKDIYDQVTLNGPALYEKPCVRLPYFDNTMHDGYDASVVTGMHNVRDEWKYPHENSLNGGQIAKNLYGYDPYDLGQFPALGNV